MYQPIRNKEKYSNNYLRVNPLYMTPEDFVLWNGMASCLLVQITIIPLVRHQSILFKTQWYGNNKQYITLKTIIFTLLCLPIEILSYYSMTTFKLPRKQKIWLKSNIYMNKTVFLCGFICIATEDFISLLYQIDVCFYHSSRREFINKIV